MGIYFLPGLAFAEDYMADEMHAVESYSIVELQCIFGIHASEID